MRILLIEDSPSQAKLILMAMESTGFEITWEQSLPLGNPPPCDLILTDLWVEPFERDSIVLALRRLYPLTPIVVLTSNEDPDLHASCLARGATCVCCKSDDDQTVIRSIKTACEIQQRKIETAGRLLQKAIQRVSELDSDLI